MPRRPVRGVGAAAARTTWQCGAAARLMRGGAGDGAAVVVAVSPGEAAARLMRATGRSRVRCVLGPADTVPLPSFQ